MRFNVEHTDALARKLWVVDFPKANMKVSFSDEEKFSTLGGHPIPIHRRFSDHFNLHNSYWKLKLSHFSCLIQNFKKELANFMSKYVLTWLQKMAHLQLRTRAGTFPGMTFRGGEKGLMLAPQKPRTCCVLPLPPVLFTTSAWSNTTLQQPLQRDVKWPTRV